jgi:5-formyltetrahydrofolate cyclo-ligase
MNDAARPDLDAEKAGLRAEMQLKRERAHAAAGPAASLSLRDRFFEAVGPVLLKLPGAVISGFWPFGHPGALPVVVRRGLPLLFRAWRPGQSLVTGSFGVPRPDKDQPELTPRMLIVPLLAFDRTGYRLGYGGGFYDRTLASLRANGPALAVGVGFALQELPFVPHDSVDERLDWMVTEREAFHIGET